MIHAYIKSAVLGSFFCSTYLCLAAEESAVPDLLLENKVAPRVEAKFDKPVRMLRVTLKLANLSNAVLPGWEHRTLNSVHETLYRREADGTLTLIEEDQAAFFGPVLSAPGSPLMRDPPIRALQPGEAASVEWGIQLDGTLPTDLGDLPVRIRFNLTRAGPYLAIFTLASGGQYLGCCAFRVSGKTRGRRTITNGVTSAPAAPAGAEPPARRGGVNGSQMRHSAREGGPR